MDARIGVMLLTADIYSCQRYESMTAVRQQNKFGARREYIRAAKSQSHPGRGV